MNDPSRDPAKRPRCQTCVYYAWSSSTGGECHRSTPDVAGHWPPIENYDWCGEHQDFAAWAGLTKGDSS